MLRTERALLQDFSRAIRARTGTRQASYFEKIGVRRLLGALPVWLVNLSDIHRVLPLEGEAFDLAVIDEATQCDIASALPILQRARRAVITGDPKQLRHLSFLPKARQQAIAAQYGLDEEALERWNFRDVSLLDLASAQIRDQRQIAFLNEHFRSRPEIIAFSNREFYGGQLQVMTGLRASESALGAPLQIQRLPGARRADSGINRDEADAILEALLSLAKDQGDLPADSVHSIGILSPFRAQVDHLRQRISRHPDAYRLLNRHDLLIGTAHSFQGEERDVMCLSLAIDDTSPAASFRFLEKPDVFNVSITRARLLNRVWHSFDPARLAPESLLQRYLRQAETDRNPPRPTASPARDRFATEVTEALQAAGAEVWPHFPLAGMEVDLLFTLDGTTRGIDLIGFPGATADAFPLERVLTFRRAGLPILPLPYSAWHCQRDRCLDWLTGAKKTEPA
ncbi:MAG: DNA2/NAM7 family helicase [Verrucomicrobiae bacterium]|nr:DNA2/NAM7 family helicase [Verrucomicrobiae bacterium]